MKRIVLIAILLFLAAVSAATAQGQTKEDEKRIKEVVKKAAALGAVDSCELNDGEKNWFMPNRKPVGDLPVYRCEVHDFDGNWASYMQIPDGSMKKEAVEFCTFSDYYVKCEVVPADRPAGRAADLAKFKVKERQFEPITCGGTSVGTIPMSVCSKPRAKPEPGLLNKLLGRN